MTANVDIFPNAGKIYTGIIYPTLEDLAHLKSRKNIANFISFYGDNNKVCFVVSSEISQSSVFKLIKECNTPLSNVCYVDILKQVEKSLGSVKFEPCKNEPRRLGYRWERTFAVKGKFTFGLKTVQHDTVHIIQTGLHKIIYYENNEYVPKDYHNRTFKVDLLKTFKSFMLDADSAYIINGGKTYFIVTFVKTIFSLNVIRKSALSDAGIPSDCKIPGFPMEYPVAPTPSLFMGKSDEIEFRYPTSHMNFHPETPVASQSRAEPETPSVASQTHISSPVASQTHTLPAESQICDPVFADRTCDSPPACSVTPSSTCSTPPVCDDTPSTIRASPPASNESLFDISSLDLSAMLDDLATKPLAAVEPYIPDNNDDFLDLLLGNEPPSKKARIEELVEDFKTSYPSEKFDAESVWSMPPEFKKPPPPSSMPPKSKKPQTSYSMPPMSMMHQMPSTSSMPEMPFPYPMLPQMPSPYPMPAMPQMPSTSSMPEMPSPYPMPMMPSTSSMIPMMSRMPSTSCMPQMPRHPMWPMQPFMPPPYNPYFSMMPPMMPPQMMPFGMMPPPSSTFVPKKRKLPPPPGI